MTGQRIGYVRVSAFDQNPERQIEGIQVDRTFLFLHLDPAGYERTAQAAESNFCELGLSLE